MTLSKFENRGNNKKIKCSFKKQEVSETNLIVITKEKYEEIYLEKKEDYPFLDSDKRDFVTVKPKSLSKKIGFVSIFDKDRGFKEKSLNFNVYDLILNGYLENFVDFPFSFNYDNFFTMTNRLDVFSNISKIQRSETTIDSLKGFSVNSLGNSNSAFGENLQIKNFIFKNEDSPSHYEDNIIPGFLTVTRDKIVVDKILRNVNPINRSITNRIIVKKKNVISSDVRYFIKKETNILPFHDKNHKQNDPSLSGEDNLFMFTSEVINNKILNNRNINDAIEESKTYMSRGKSYDRSISNGKDSFLFSEGIDWCRRLELKQILLDLQSF